MTLANIIRAILFFSVTFIYSCGPLTDYSKSSSGKKNTVKSTIAENETASLEITEGDAKGTSVAVPPGALAVGSSINMSAIKTPTEFSLDSASSASSAISIEARSSDGSAITNLNTPMTISIPMSTSSLFLADANDDNLCALLKTAANTFFVWKRSALTIDTANNKASFTSLNLGIFQLVYCGDETPEGFIDAEDSGVSAGTDKISFKLDGSKYAYGAAKYCSILLHEKDTEETDKDSNEALTLLARKEVSVTSDTLDLSLSYSSDSIPDDHIAIFAIIGQQSTQSCSNLVIGGNLEEMELQYDRVFVFPLSLTDLRSGKADGEFGKGQYTMGSLNLSTNKSFDAAASYHSATHACIQVENKDYGSAEYSVDIDGSGNISGSQNPAFVFPTGNTITNAKMNVRFADSCGPDNNKDDSTSYEIKFPFVTSGSQYYLAPVLFNKHSSPIPGAVSCLAIYDDTGSTSSYAEGHYLGELNIAMDSDTPAYIPWTPSGTTPTYDLLIYAAKTCDNKNDSVVSPLERTKTLQYNINQE